MKETPLFEEHNKLGGRIVDFAGYAMPVQYKGIKDEYLNVRNSVGIFDISHMCPMVIKCEDEKTILDFLNFHTCRNVSSLKPGKVQYNALPNENGGLHDDITIYNIDYKNYIMLVNASNAEKVIKHLNSKKQGSFESVAIEPFKNYILMALQGKDSQGHLEKTGLLSAEKLDQLFFYEFALLKGFESPFFISRTGYSGEDGFEILLPSENGLKIWKQLVENGVMPCGLGARDLLRLEVFYPLYGNELQEDWTPIESSIDWIVSDKKDYLGKSEIFKNPPRFKVCGFLMNEKGAMPRSHYPVYDQNGNPIGEVTSGGFSFIWDKGFGMAKLNTDFAVENAEIYIEIRGNKIPAKVALKSPYQGSIKRRKK